MLHTYLGLYSDSVITAYAMCENCTNLVDIGEVNFPNCENFRMSFIRCGNLTTMPILPNMMKNDTSYRYMYAECYNMGGEVSNVSLYNCELSATWSRTNINKFTNLHFENCEIAQAITPNCDFTVDNITVDGCNAHYLFGLNVANAVVQNISITNLTIKNSIVQGLFNSQSNVYKLENIRLENCRT